MYNNLSKREEKDMAEFYKHFSQEEKDFIVKEFISWQKMGLAVEEMIDDVVEIKE